MRECNGEFAIWQSGGNPPVAGKRSRSSGNQKKFRQLARGSQKEFRNGESKSRNETYSMSKMGKVHSVIHTASASAAGVGAGLAQLPGSDSVPIVGLQTSMIVAIALIHGHAITKATAISLLGTFTATMTGRAISQLLVGWIPGIGNAINAATAASITELVGWAAHAYFADLGSE